jgi:hypothetical protein
MFLGAAKSQDDEDDDQNEDDCSDTDDHGRGSDRKYPDGPGARMADGLIVTRDALAQTPQRRSPTRVSAVPIG